MPQLMIDTSAESAESLRLLAVLLTSYAGIKDAEAGIDRTTGQSIAHAVRAATAAAAAAEHIPMPYDADQHNALQAEQAAAIFAKNAPVVPQGTDNVVQLFPGAPTLPAVTSAVTLPAMGTPAFAPAVVSPTEAPATVAAVTASELDKANIPWDARIHQTNRNKKADGTWMLKRGLDKAIAESVLAELTAAKLPTPAAPAAGPVSLPPPPVSLPSGLPVPPVTTLPPPPAGATLPGLPAGLPAVSLPATLTPVQRFSAMMVKINAAKTSGQIDQNMIDEAHKALDLPQLQLAITQPDKIPLIEAALGL